MKLCKDSYGLIFIFLVCLLTACEQNNFQNISPDQYIYRQPGNLNDGFTTATPDDVSLDQTNFDNLIRAILRNEFGKIDSILIYKNNKLIVEEYFNGFNQSTRHDLRSATKSITSLLTGIAIDRGVIESIDDPVYPFFIQDYVYFDNWITDKNDITIKHLLNMASGLDCNDHGLFSEGQEDQMYIHRDWYKYILDVRLIRTPGKYFAYCTGGVILLGGIIRRSSRKSVTLFSEEVLFSKLDIGNYHWSYSPDGSEDTGGHLFLRPRDFLKLGVLFHNKGKWINEQIISESWINMSSEKYFPFYGYLWWKDKVALGNESNPFNVEYINASGNGGQSIFIVSDLDAVIVTTGSNYDENELHGNLVNQVLASAYIESTITN